MQWNVDPDTFEIGRQYVPPVDERLYPKIIEYELEAARYGLELCHQAGVTSIEEWFSVYTACDQKYFIFIAQAKGVIFAASGRMTYVWCNRNRFLPSTQ